MEFTDRLMAVDRAVSSYTRFSGEPAPPQSEVVQDLISDLLHWHSLYIEGGEMSKRKVRAFVGEAIKTFYEERDAKARGERPMNEPRREYPEEYQRAVRNLRVRMGASPEERAEAVPFSERNATVPFDRADEGYPAEAPADPLGRFTDRPTPMPSGWQPPVLSLEEIGEMMLDFPEDTPPTTEEVEYHHLTDTDAEPDPF